ncbi:hypothetical protein SB778_03835 [Paraburkholderia sp. SIMBA_050]
MTAKYTERANAIAQALGGTAQQQSAEHENGHFYITLAERDPDARLLARFEPYRMKGRVAITTSWPLKTRDGHAVVASNYVPLHKLVELDYQHEITAALTKRDEQIAADIKRRMLEPYLAVLKLTREALKIEEREEDERDTMIERLASHAGVVLTSHCKQSRRFTRYHQPTTRCLEVDASGSSVTVTLKWITPEIAEKAVALFVDTLPQ